MGARGEGGHSATTHRRPQTELSARTNECSVSSRTERCHEIVVAGAEAEVSGLSGHRERLTEVLRGKVWRPGPQEDRGWI